MKKILLIKDKDTVINKKHYEESGYMVVILTDGYSSVDVLGICTFDFILVDHLLLTVDGKGIHDDIRRYCDTPIFVFNNSENYINDIMAQERLS